MNQDQTNEQSCIRILYHRVAHVFPGANLDQIERVELKDGTVLFVGGVDGSVVVDINNRRDAWRDEYKIGGPVYFESPEVNISVPAPWAFIAYRDGQIIDDDSCKREIVRRWVVETLEREAEDACGHLPSVPPDKEIDRRIW